MLQMHFNIVMSIISLSMMSHVLFVKGLTTHNVCINISLYAINKYSFCIIEKSHRGVW